VEERRPLAAAGRAVHIRAQDRAVAHLARDVALDADLEARHGAIIAAAWPGRQRSSVQARPTAGDN
jgi:hypothetical protein